MPQRAPAAFFSYVHADDEYDRGITQLHAALEGEARLQIGTEFPIFLDRDDLLWGDNWKQRIDESLDTVSLLIPVITPAFFRSPECRRELERFVEREETLARSDLVWPIYYVHAPEMDEPGDDRIAQLLASRQYADWRELRFEPFTSPTVRQRLAVLAAHLRESTRRIAQPTAGGESESPHVGERMQGPAPAEPPSRTVDPYGRGADHQTITDAIAAAAPGDRILIRPGLYQEALTIDKPLELIGQGRVEEIVVTARDAHVIQFRTNIGRVSNLMLRQTGGAEPNWHCVDIGQGRLELEDCDITSQTLAAVGVHDGADPRIRRNRIHDGSQGGVFVYRQGLGTVEDNDVFANAQAGIQITGASNPTVRRNRFNDNGGSGIFLFDGGLGTFEDNEITRNAYSGVEIKANSRATLRRNRIYRNAYEAIFVHEASGGTFEGNNLTDNPAGAWDIAADCENEVVRRDNQE